MSADFTPEKEDLKILTPFKMQVLTNFPYIEADFDALTNYQLLCKVVEYLNKVIAESNEVTEQTLSLYNAYVALQNYVNTYFDNLDLQSIVDNKLDEMAEDGTLADMIAEYIKMQGQLVYNNVSDMKAAENIQNGSFLKTYGYYSYKDGGGAIYKARTITNEDVIDNALIIALHDNTLVAELIIDNNMLNAKQLGCHLDKNTDDTTLLQHAIDIAYEKRYDLIINGFAYVTETIQTKGVHIIGVGEPANCYQTYTSKKYGYLAWDYLRNTGDGALITFDDYKDDILTQGSGIISDIASPILENNYSYGEQYYGQFYLENLCICGWLRNENQIGIATKLDNDTPITYARGIHHFKNLNVINCGGTGIYLNSLEMVELYNVKSKFNFGYGLFIEGVDGIDTPFEYVVFNTCEFSGNKLGNIYALNSFRKNITFTNCRFYFTGLYLQLDIAIPTTTSEIIPAIKISGTESTDGAVAKENININNCYGEDTRVLLHLDQQNKNINNINIYNNTILPESAQDYYCILYLNAYYCDKFNFYSNKFNGSNQIILANINQLKPVIVDVNYYNAYNPVSPLTINNNFTHMDGQVELINVKRYGNIVELDATMTATADVAAYTSLISNIPKPAQASYFVGLLNNTDNFRLNCYTNGSISSPTAITSGDKIQFHLIYFTEYNVSK